MSLSPHFNDTTANLRLASNDGTIFGVHSYYLHAATSVV